MRVKRPRVCRPCVGPSPTTPDNDNHLTASAFHSLGKTIQKKRSLLVATGSRTIDETRGAFIVSHVADLVRGPGLRARLSHSARTASSSSAAPPGRSAGSSAAPSSGQPRSNLWPAQRNSDLTSTSLCPTAERRVAFLFDTNLDVVVSLDQSFSDLGG